MAKIRTHKFLDQQWNIVFDNRTGDSHAYCEAPHKKEKKIKLRKDLDERELMTYAIHESLHACFWFMSEEFVNRAASDIARFLWRLGFRKVDPND